MFIQSKFATRSAYPSELRQIMNMERAAESREWLSYWKILNPSPTPLVSLAGFAKAYDLAEVSVKDEAKRALLRSFKALGASIALIRLILRHHPKTNFTAESLFTGKHAKELKDFTVISATAGNHGTSLAAAARDIGCRCVIVLSKNVSMERENTIASYGAEIIRIEGDYDDSVEHAEALAQSQGWLVVSDTSYEGYEEIPRDVMQGYATIVAEVIEQTEHETSSTPPYSHVIVQGGVGGFAAGVVAYLWERYGEQRPLIIVVEPDQADCLYQSALVGRATSATGSVNSLMGGLACGEASPLAWQFLQPSSDFFITVTDEQAVAAMRALAAGQHGDRPLVSGGSGAAGYAALEKMLNDPQLRDRVGLNAQSRVLLFNTEGATAPSEYLAQVGKSAAEIEVSLA